MRRFYFPLLMILFFVYTKSFAQDIPVKGDSLDLKTGVTGELPKQADSLRSGQLPLRFPRLNPAENLLPQFTPYQRFTLTPQHSDTNLPPIHWHGAASDFINTKSRTAIATTMPMPGLLLHSSATIGLVETPFFGKGYYYILDAGAHYTINPALMMGISGGYNSNFGVMPFWNTGIDASYQLNRNLMFDGGLTYMKTAGNMFSLNQSAVMVDLHGRYRLSDDWYLNAYGGMPVLQNNNQPNRPMMPMMNTPYYGGSVEHWFKPTMGVEAGMIWIRDMFSGKMRPQPKLELLFRPGR
ncbi:hypothetical protein [uncultured Proteiniphilum sp.]|uniref:hypothetical protein n=1 Tax=uncultured Proteiniphilum sp. TaxID=497637 RepID=UPI0026382188|nr:hypothetical protein [uncultured Proteiniphilum sp.]